MPPTGIIATITSILKPTRSSQQPSPSSFDHNASDEEAGLIPPSPSTPTSPQRTYGTLPYVPLSHTPHSGHSAEDEALDGNDQAIWEDVQTQGLDGRGSIADTDESVEEEIDRYEEEQAQLKDGECVLRCAAVVRIAHKTDTDESSPSK